MEGLPEALVVFGASGFIGRNIVEAARGTVGRIVGVTRRGAPVPGCHQSVALGRLADIAPLPRHTVAINVAAVRYDPGSFASEQGMLFDGNSAIVNAFYGFCLERGIKEARQASSSAVYVAGADPLDDSVPIDLNLPPNRGELGYAWSRRWAELSADIHHQVSGINTRSFRLTNPFGAYDTLDDRAAHVATALIIRVLKEDGPLRLFGNPEAQRDFVHGGDVAHIFLESCKAGGVHDAMNLARGEVISIRGFAELILAAAGRGRPIEVSQDLPPGVNIRRATGQRLREAFPEVTLRPLEESLKETIAWYREALNV